LHDLAGVILVANEPDRDREGASLVSVDELAEGDLPRNRVS
jgi:hypothetical protein